MKYILVPKSTSKEKEIEINIKHDCGVKDIKTKLPSDFCVRLRDGSEFSNCKGIRFNTQKNRNFGDNPSENGEVLEKLAKGTSGPIALSFWIRPTGWSRDRTTILWWGSVNKQSPFINLSIKDEHNLYFEERISDNVTSGVLNTNGKLLPFKWNLITLARSSMGGSIQWKIWVNSRHLNGVAAPTFTHTPNVSLDLNKCNHDIIIGASALTNSSNKNDELWDYGKGGTFDFCQFRAINKEITIEMLTFWWTSRGNEIPNLSENFTPISSNYVIYAPCDEMYGTLVEDTSQNGSDGEYVNYIELGHLEKENIMTDRMFLRVERDCCI